MSDTPQIPGFVRFIWMIFMQPLLLSEKLGLNLADLTIWKLWIGSKNNGVFRQKLIVRIMLLLLLLAPCQTFLLAWLLGRFGYAVDVGSVVFSVCTGIFFAFLIGSVEDLLSGLMAGLSLSPLFCISEIVGLPLLPMLLGFTGLVLSVHPKFARMLGPMFHLAAGVLIYLLCSSYGGVFLGVASGLSFFLMATRFPFYLVEIVWQWLARNHAQFSPVFYHEGSQFPHPFLYKIMVNAREQDHDLYTRLLQAIERSPGQMALGHRVMKKDTEPEIPMPALEPWMDHVRRRRPILSAEDFLPDIAHITYHLHAAECSKDHDDRVHNLETAQALLNALREYLLEERTYLSYHVLDEILPDLYQTLDEQLEFTHP